MIIAKMLFIWRSSLNFSVFASKLQPLGLVIIGNQLLNSSANLSVETLDSRPNVIS